MSATIAAKAKRKQKPKVDIRPPELIMQDFFAAQRGAVDGISLQDVLGEILEDVVDTVRRTLDYHLSEESSVDPADITTAIVFEVEDYIANYYADGTGEIASSHGAVFVDLDDPPDGEDEDYEDGSGVDPDVEDDF